MDNQEEGDFTRKQESRPEKEGAPAFVASSSSGPQPTSNQYPAAAGFQDSEDSFPFRLHQLLQDATQYGFDAIVSWTPGGTAFIVHDRDQFSTQIMHMYFAHTQFKSFQRQINLYDFERIKRGNNRGGYFHKYFFRDNKRLCHLITRTIPGEGGRGKRKRSTTSTSPDSTLKTGANGSRKKNANDRGDQADALVTAGADQFDDAPTDSISPHNNSTAKSKRGDTDMIIARTTRPDGGMAPAGSASHQSSVSIQPWHFRTASLIEATDLSLNSIWKSNSNVAAAGMMGGYPMHQWEGNQLQRHPLRQEGAAAANFTGTDRRICGVDAATAWMKHHEVDLSQFAQSLVSSTKDHHDDHHYASGRGWSGRDGGEPKRPTQVFSSPVLASLVYNDPVSQQLSPAALPPSSGLLMSEEDSHRRTTTHGDFLLGAASTTTPGDHPDALGTEDNHPDHTATIAHEIISTFKKSDEASHPE